MVILSFFCCELGFIGKGLTRHINRVWNYLFKGFLGTVVIVFLFPVVCLLASSGSILLALTAPIWMPFITAILHLYIMVVYDLDSPDSSENRYCVIMEAILWNIIFQGFVQPIFAVFVAAFVCPIVSVCVLFGKSYL